MPGFVITEKVFKDIVDEYVQNEANETAESIEHNANEDHRVYLHGKVCEFIHNTYAENNSDYGNSFAKVREKYPEAICVYLNDKLSRLEQLLKPGHERKVKDEAIEDTLDVLSDLACYAIIELVEILKEKEDEVQDGKSN